MTMIDVDTSPLQAAREWRGISLVAVAMNCGLPVAQAEALEDGDLTAFASVDEMIAAAVVYGASIGVGRDEAMALLDRTVTHGSGATAAVPDIDPVPADVRPNDAFSGAVQERSARIAGRDDCVATPPLLTPALLELPADESAVAAYVPVDEPAAPGRLDIELPAVPEGPTPEQAVAASGELHLDEAFGPDAPWERAGQSSELEAWVEDLEEEARPVARAGDATLTARIGGTLHAAMERIVGTDRADTIADRTRDLGDRITELARDGREKLRRSEHATLIVAIGAGAILIAIVVALGGALDGSDEPVAPAPTSATTAAATTASGAAKTGAKADKQAAPVKPVIPPARLTVDVYNAGSQKGKAKTVADKVKGYGYKIGAVTNAKSSYGTSTIIHPADMTREARTLARRTGITNLQVAPGSTRKITLIVT